MAVALMESERLVTLAQGRRRDVLTRPAFSQVAAVGENAEPT